MITTEDVGVRRRDKAIMTAYHWLCVVGGFWLASLFFTLAWAALIARKVLE